MHVNPKYHNKIPKLKIR